MRILGYGLGFKIKGLGFRVEDLGSVGLSSGFGAQGLELVLAGSEHSSSYFLCSKRELPMLGIPWKGF